ncbi:MAG: hypothetical protein MR316_07355 [Lachnospiraceae bacterium]|nr:hypothetical protein [Lachnospiraceae bacterium]
MTIRLFLYDLKVGIRAKWKLYLVMIVFVLYMIVSFYAVQLRDGLSYMGLLRELFYGVNPMSEIERTEVFRIPYDWLAFFMVPTVLAIRYPKGILEQQQMSGVLRANNRRELWCSKLLYVISHSLFCCILIYGILFFIVLAYGNPMSGAVKRRPDIGMFTNTQLYMVVFVIPFLLVVTFGIAAMVLSMVFNEMTALVIVLGYIVCCVYGRHVCLLGNFAMLRRYPAMGRITMRIVQCCLGSIGAIMVFSVLGLLFLHHYEWIKKEKEQ